MPARPLVVSDVKWPLAYCSGCHRGRTAADPAPLSLLSAPEPARVKAAAYTSYTQLAWISTAPSKAGRWVGRTVSQRYQSLFDGPLAWPAHVVTFRVALRDDLFCWRQPVASAAAAGALFYQNTLGDQVRNVAAGRVLGTLGHACPLRGGQLALEAVEQPQH